MALIKCECGREISDQATKCPHCGKERTVAKTEEKSTKGIKPLWLVIGGIIVLVIGGLLIGWFVYSKAKSEITKMTGVDFAPSIAEGRYKISLEKICFADLDWSVNSFGNPFDIRMTIYKDGNPICSRDLSGSPRGERLPNIHTTFEIDYSKYSNYQIKLAEFGAIIASTRSWLYPAEPLKGAWFFTGEKLKITPNTWLQFKAEKVK